jgi:hypothetical protein
MMVVFAIIFRYYELLKGLSALSTVLSPCRVVLPFPFSDAHADEHRSSIPASLSGAVKKRC